MDDGRVGERVSRGGGKGGKERAAAAAGCIKSEAGKKQVTRGISWSAARCGRQVGIISFRPFVHIASSSFLIGSAFLPTESDNGADGPGTTVERRAPLLRAGTR